MTGPKEPSPWIVRFAGLVRAGGPVLDLACGSGRHTALFLERRHPVTAVDRDVSRLGRLGATAGLEVVEADLERETGGGWPLAERRFAGIVVTNYLYRPLFPAIMAALEPDGVLLYETFALGNEAFGKPANPDHLLRPGELLELARGRLSVIAYEHGRVERPRPAVVQRLAAANPAGPEAALRAHPLAPAIRED